ncbi:MAG TPA: glycosyltransferase [Candidatus Saccharimonadales bacterium]|nr:glycosyltransferase [Candidatus Saccharimonadales bacterium]
MLISLIGLAAVSIWELLLYVRWFWSWRKPMAAIAVPLLAVFSAQLLYSRWHLLTGLVLVASFYRIINLLRLVEGRIQADYLFRVARQSSFWLIIGQSVALGLYWLMSHESDAVLHWWAYGLVGLQLAAALSMAASTQRHLRTTRPPIIDKHYPDRDLPSLTVAIPARNETDDLEACLNSLIANDYPKLEILVLDDCSQGKRTAEIIRAYAHDGVRFLAGKTPPKDWLAKNYAYQQIAAEANGEFLLFCGVDSRFGPESLRNIVETALTKHKTMYSILPRNKALSRWNIHGLLIQPSRYAWELSLPRRLLQCPPVLSTCWLISAKVLHAAGGFKAVVRSSSPESYFARYAASHEDGYSFLQSDAALAVSSEKAVIEQRFTALRTRYPQLHRRPELVGAVSVLELFIILGPLIEGITGLVTGHWLLAILGGISYALVTVAYCQVVALTYRQFLLRGLWVLPFATMYDIGLLQYSMQQYEFGEMIWKGRNVCLPLMRAIPTLPKA